MANKGINTHINNVISALNTKADTNLANSARATEIASIAESAASAANSANIVAQAASELINTSLPTKVNKFGDTINGNLIVDGNMTVTGEINATITGSSESAMSATKDSNGNVIVDTYLTKTDAANKYVDLNTIQYIDNTKKFNEGIVATTPTKTSDGINIRIRHHQASKSTLIRNDGSSTWFLLTADNDPDGTWETPELGHPIRILHSTGQVYINNGIPVSVVASWVDGINFYKKYSDGFIEQGGTINFSIGVQGGYEATVHLNFHIPFTYYPRTILMNAIGSGMVSCCTQNYSTTGFDAKALAYSQWREWGGVTWYAYGY
jgi:hypothetical protein